MKATELVNYYLREDIKEFLLDFFTDREVALRYINGKYSERPYIILHEGDYNLAVKNFVSSFHCSVEKWSDVGKIKNAKSKELDELRIGWDLLIDLDTKVKDINLSVKLSKIASKIIIKKIKAHGIRNIFIKYSGNKGFHILLPYQTFPEKVNGENINLLFPNAGRVVIEYIKWLCKGEMKEEILKNFSIREISKLGFKKEINPYDAIELDPMLLSVRHLFRAPYSLNEKSYLVSLPISARKIEEFNIEEAKPENVEVNDYFKIKGEKGEAKKLFIQAYDWYVKNFANEIKKEIREYKVPLKAIDMKFFPPCIKNILKGLSDGRKRALFILINFLKDSGYSMDKIEEIVYEWNNKNEEPLRESYIRGQLNWFRKLKKLYLPPNCNNKGYYIDIGVCQKDEICKEIKNPLTYVFKVRKKWRKKK